MADEKNKKSGTDNGATEKDAAEKVGFFEKVKGFVKKHGKKIAIGAGIAAAGAAGFVLGNKHGSNSSDDDLEYIDLDEPEETFNIDTDDNE